VGALGLVLVPALLLALVALPPSSAPRFLFMAVSYAAYLAIFIGVTLAVSARARTARQALVVLLGFWIFACLAWPRLAADLAAWIHPTPSAVAFREALRREQGESHPPDRALAIQARIMKEYGVTRPEDLPIDWRGIALQEGEEANHPIFDRHFGALFDIYRAQLRAQQWAAIASPLLAVAPLSTALAGTDVEHHWRFVQAAEAQRRAIQKVMNDDLTLHGKDVDYKAGAEMWKRIAEFQPPAAPVCAILPQYLIAACVLALWLVATTLFAWRSIDQLKP
jgi:ABC-2 type transport system permease protein